MPDVISIHAPAKGATIPNTNVEKKSVYFNPRSREGSDLSDNLMNCWLTCISIHAPAKGATK